MRLIALPILSSISIALLASCVQSDEEYFKQLKREGISQEQKENRQSSRSSYGLDEFQREKEEAARETLMRSVSEQPSAAGVADQLHGKSPKNLPQPSGSDL